MLESTTAIASLRVRAPVRDWAALQHAIDRQFQGVELTPPELPPSALFLVRHLDDPLPGRIGGHPHRFRPPQEWTEAVRNRLALLLAEAERPQAGCLPSASNAVLFSDEAEVVASLVLDLARGEAGSRWWWRCIGVALPELATATANAGMGAVDPGTVLRARPRDIPAVFGYLAQWSSAVEVASAFDYGRTCELLQAMAFAHQIDPMVIGPENRTHPGAESGNIIGSPTPVGSLPKAHSLAEAHSNLELSELAEDRDRVDEPWLPWLPTSAPQRSLSPGQRCLLGLALALQTAPTLVRQRSFAQSAQAWWQHQERFRRLSAWYDHDEQLGQYGHHPRPDVSRDSITSSPNSSGAQTDLAAEGEAPSAKRPDETQLWDRYSPERHGIAPVEKTPARSSGTAPSSREPHPWKRPAYADHQSDPAAAHVLEDVEDAAYYGAADRESVTSGSAVPDQVTDTSVPLLADSAQLQTETRRPGSITFLGEPFDTSLGGILYLIHALEDLDIPMVFENGWGLTTRLGPWGTLDLIARALLGDRLTDVAGDAIWAVLARLTPQVESGSPANLVAASDDAHRLPHSRQDSPWSATTPDYGAPAQWRAALDEPGDALRWSTGRDHLWLWSLNGYLIASVRRNKQSPEQQACALAAAWQGEAPTHLRRGPLDQAPVCHLAGGHWDADLCAWATAAAPAVAHRLGLALGVEADDGEALLRLLSVEARLYVTRSHVDLVAGIDQIWLPARRAGLDRNPGWLADYGRVVLFHFV